MKTDTRILESEEVGLLRYAFGKEIERLQSSILFYKSMSEATKLSDEERSSYKKTKASTEAHLEDVKKLSDLFETGPKVTLTW